jgi:D-cysteine desulfhydrase family pyridoxal phosphate-dependent enzyme
MDISEAKQLFSKIPKEKLGFFPTPFHKLERLSEELEMNLYIKRDDFTGRGLFGGNKIRKLQYLMADAKAKGCEYVFTYGAVQSNHAMQTVTACRCCGLKPILYLVSIVQTDEDDVRSNLLLDKIMDAEIHIVEENGTDTEVLEQRSIELAREHMKLLESQGHKCYDIPMGGASEIGSAGFIEGFIEMTAQAESEGFIPDYVFHGTGTGGTAAGLVAGRNLIDSSAKIISVNVSYKPENYNEKISELSNKALMYIGIEPNVKPEDFIFDLNYYMPGYELPNERANNAIKRLAASEGILIDPVYTGKAFYGLLDYIESGRVPRGSNVVFWHTGGATALFAEKEILGNLLD